MKSRKVIAIRINIHHVHSLVKEPILNYSQRGGHAHVVPGVVACLLWCGESWLGRYSKIRG